MKNLPLVVALLLVFATNALGQEAIKPTPEPSPKPKPVMSKAQIQKNLIATEKKLWEAWKNKDSKPFKAAISADAVMIGEHGVGGKDAIVKEISEGDCVVKSFELSDFKLTMLNPSVALLTYKGTADGTCAGT